MKVLTNEDFVNLFKSQKTKQNRLIGLKTRKVLETNKTSRITGKTLLEEFNSAKIIQESSSSTQINIDYENAVNNRLENLGEERDFKAQKRSWGEYVEGTNNCVVTHKDQLYLHCFQTNSEIGKSYKYFREDGSELTEKEVDVLKAEFLKEKREEIKSQDLSYKESVKPRDYNIHHITEISMDGEKYRIA